jgi:tetratricopeptide (TPR) repeat protein
VKSNTAVSWRFWKERSWTKIRRRGGWGRGRVGPQAKKPNVAKPWGHCDVCWSSVLLHGKANSRPNWLTTHQIGLELSAEDKIRQAYRLNGVFAYRAALDILGEVNLSPKAPRPLRCKFHQARGFAWFRLRKYRDALRDLVPAAALCKGIEYEEVRVLYRLGQAYRRLGKVSPSILWMRRLAARYPKHYLADDAVFAVAELLERSKREEAAKTTYARLLRDFPKGDMALYARWRLGLSSLSCGPMG